MIRFDSGNTDTHLKGSDLRGSLDRGIEALGSILTRCGPGNEMLGWLDLQLRNILDMPVVGGLLKTLSESFFSITGVSNIQFIVFGLILILIMVFEPWGLFGFWIRTKKYWKTWPF